MKIASRLPKWFCRVVCFTLVASIGSLTAVGAFEDRTHDNSRPTVEQPETVKCNTKVDWHTDWREAFALADQTGKPLYVLHLSGNLQNEKFT